MDGRADEQAIARFLAADNGGDVANLLERQLRRRSREAQARGRGRRHGDLATRLRKTFAQYHGQLVVQNDEPVVAGDLAYARGTLSVTLTPRDAGEPVRVTRRFIEIWRKRAGRWLVVRTMDNDGPGAELRR